MEPWKTAWRRGLVGGAVASLLSTFAMSALGKRESGSPYAATNAVSHWFWGDQAFRQHALSTRYTLPGYLIHHGCAVFWAVIFERLCGHLLDRKEPPLTLGVATSAAAVACLVDYQCTPRRLQPGYEAHLSRPSLAVVYAGFGLGLALGAMLCRRS